MVRSGDWTMEVNVGGTAQKEHLIDGRTVVQSAPGKDFTIFLETDGLDGLFLVEAWVDGKKLGAGYQIDPGRATSRGGNRSVTFKGWEKSKDGHIVNSQLVFNAAAADDEEGSRPAAVQGWEHGKIEVRVLPGYVYTLPQDSHAASHNADMSKKITMDESALVKNGLSSTAGAGAKSFSASSVWRAGETCVAEDKSAPRVATLECFYRDSFFMALREDTCCHGACASRPANSDTLRSAAASLPSGVGSSVRDRLVRERETAEKLSSKRPKTEEEKIEIDLCADSDEE